MKKFIQFWVHDYMDMYPSVTTKVMDTENIESFLKHMNEMYSGGTTSLKGILTKEEAVEHLCKTLKECLMDTKWPDEDNLAECNNIFCPATFKDFFECYGRDVKE